LHHLNEGILFTEGRIDEWRNQIGQGALWVIDFATLAAEKSKFKKIPTTSVVIVFLSRKFWHVCCFQVPTPIVE
jgi:hypothetical protein